jgi:hypothetical protein
MTRQSAALFLVTYIVTDAHGILGSRSVQRLEIRSFLDLVQALSS